MQGSGGGNDLAETLIIRVYVWVVPYVLMMANPLHLKQKGVSVKDTLKFAAMLLVAALIWTVVNPVRIIVSVIVTAFPLVMIAIIAYLAFAGYQSLINNQEEEV